MDDMRSIRKLLMQLDDESLLALLGMKAASQPCGADSGFWFDKKLCGLAREGRERLREQEEALRNPAAAPHVDKRQVRYWRQLMRMRIRAPDFFREQMQPKALYRQLTGFCREHDIPQEIVERMIPSLLEYIRTGRMRPVMFIGEKGCGKTTAVKLLVQEALKLPTEVIKVPQTDGGHGMTGDCGTYRSADVGAIAGAQLRHRSLLVAYIFDEIDKVPRGRGGPSLDDELLSITDESRSEVVDSYLECPLTALEHCPMFFTGNDLSGVNPILADRCTVVHFPPADAQRIKSVMRKYVDRTLCSDLYSAVSFDYELMNRSIDELVGRSVTSLRKHQQLIENVLGAALHDVLNQEGDEKVAVTHEMFEKAERAVCGAQKRRTGFGS